MSPQDTLRRIHEELVGEANIASHASCPCPSCGCCCIGRMGTCVGGCKDGAPHGEEE